MRFLLPRVSDLTETQYRLFMLAQALIVQHARTAPSAPNDHDVAEAVGTVAATLETAGKGIIYEHRATSIPAQRIADEISAAIRDLVQRAGSDGARLERDAARGLRALERAARDAVKDLPDSSRPDASWLIFATRIMEEAAHGGEAPATQRSGSFGQDVGQAGGGQGGRQGGGKEQDGPKLVI